MSQLDVNYQAEHRLMLLMSQLDVNYQAEHRLMLLMSYVDVDVSRPVSMTLKCILVYSCSCVTAAIVLS